MPRTETWGKALDSYRYPVDLTDFPDAPKHGGWFALNVAPGDPLQTMGLETRFRQQARDHLAAWAEVVFWKLYSGRRDNAVKSAARLLGSETSAADLWLSCGGYIANPSIETFRTFRSKLFRHSVVATATTFPAFICPEEVPMVDTQITHWARKNDHLHGYARLGGPDIERVPELKSGSVLKESHWPFVESWIAWCRFTAWKLSQFTGRAWRARDVEMAVFTAQRNSLTLEPLA